MKLLSVNVGRARHSDHTDADGGLTGVAKQPVAGPVRVFSPGPKGAGGSGVEGDSVCDLRFHGGDGRAVYAFAREDLDGWEQELGRPLADGSFAENLTTSGVDVSGALIGERWRVGPDAVLEVTGGRVPCRTFQGHVGEKGWVRRFTRAGAPGALLRVIEAGAFSAGDPIDVVHRPVHDITVALLFRAVTVERELLPRTLVAAEWMEPGLLEVARDYAARYGSP